ncbi:hypothetical protein NGRA_0747, partial [Nosema granulosis]
SNKSVMFFIIQQVCDVLYYPTRVFTNSLFKTHKMNERTFETQNFTVVYILKKQGNHNISVDGCVKILCKGKIAFRNFSSSGEMFFPKIKLEYPKNYLISVEIREKNKINTRSVCNILTKLFPTVFDTKRINNINLREFLNRNRERIKSMCYSILGHGFDINQDILSMMECSFDKDESEEELIYDDIIENDYFHMEI